MKRAQKSVQQSAHSILMCISPRHTGRLALVCRKGGDPKFEAQLFRDVGGGIWASNQKSLFESLALIGLSRSPFEEAGTTER